MTSKTQTMLTIALTAAVTVLLVDRIIEPAYAQNCPSASQIGNIVAEANYDTKKRLLYCINHSGINMKDGKGTLYTYCTE